MTTPGSPKMIVENAERLLGLIEAENRLLDERSPEKLSETRDRKQVLVENHRNAVNLIRTGKMQISRPEREILIRTGEKLETAMLGHARRVARMKSITEGLMHVIANEAEKKNGPAEGYGYSGQTQAATLARNAYRRPTALSVNRVI
ncbi:hypothetical protein [Minwuia sp.]|uniref:hypothetical protein n=1 Tax=Minwuia sp. TaxID=2493630 RepID=UPI003A8DE268